MPKPYDALLLSIVFGTKVTPLDEDLKENYRRVGLSHLLVASGTQVSILLGVCLAIIRFFKIPLRLGIAFASLANVFFASLVGFGSSIIRASIMGEITLLSLFLNKDADIFTSLSLSALIMMVWDPLIIFDIGFQLTFFATWSLIYIAPKLEERGVPQIISVALAPILATFPVILFNFNQFSLVALPVNLIVLPTVEILTILGFISTILSLVFLPLSEILNYFLLVLLKLVNEIVYTFASLKIASFVLPAPPIFLIAGYYMYLIDFLEKKKSFMNKAIICLFILFSLFSFGNVLASIAELKVSVIDVGQGDSILLEIPGGKNVLIDGGPKLKIDAGRKYVAPYLRSLGINKLDVVILTHPHNDHVGGLPSILKSFPVGLVLDSGQATTTKTYLDFLKIIDDKNIPYKVVRAGDNLNLGPEIEALILNPSEPFIEKSALNNNSIVLRLKYKKVSFLFTGDLEKEGEAQVLKDFSKNILGSQILKAGHHGSKTSSSQDFLEAVKPELAAISVGKNNKFGHPHPSTLERFKEDHVLAYRTDPNHTVIIKTDGNSYRVETIDTRSKAAF